MFTLGPSWINVWIFFSSCHSCAFARIANVSAFFAELWPKPEITTIYDLFIGDCSSASRGLFICQVVRQVKPARMQDGKPVGGAEFVHPRDLYFANICPRMGGAREYIHAPGVEGGNLCLRLLIISASSLREQKLSNKKCPFLQFCHKLFYPRRDA